MFNFFKRKPGKADHDRKEPSSPEINPVEARAPPENERKDVVNLLLPQTDYNQKSGVGAILQIMAGKRKRGKRKRAESCREQRPTQIQRTDSIKSVDEIKNRPDSDAAFVKALVLQKYAKPNHVSLVYVEPDDEKKRAEALLREIARSIDCTVDKLENEMGTENSKTHVYEEPDREINSFKDDVARELNSLAQTNAEESPTVRKSNLKPPRSDTEGNSDDDRSDSGRKRVTFRKHIIFDDGEQQTDEENSFESISSEEEFIEEDFDKYENVPIENNTTVINVNETPITIKIENADVSENGQSDSGFIELGERNNSGDDVTSVKSESESETEEIIEIIEEEIEEVEEFEDIEEEEDDAKSLIKQEDRQDAITHLDSASEEAERMRDVLVACRKQIEAKDQEIEQLKCSLESAYKESELVRQRSRSLEEEVAAARSCSADLADQLKHRNAEYLRERREELEESQTRRAELESRILALERDRDRLEQEKALTEQKASEALAAAEANTSKWRLAHEAARSQAAARAERILDDCEWKMRELERRARDAERDNEQLKQSVEHLKTHPPPSHVVELQQLRGLASELQRSVQTLTLQLQRAETREEELKLEVHRLKDLLEREEKCRRDGEERHELTIKNLQETHSKAIEKLKSDHNSSMASTRTALERTHAERTRNALAQLRGEAEQETKNVERKLREVTTRFENLKEVLASKESQFEATISEANSKADWNILQLRHLLDKADIDYANKVDDLTQRFEDEKEKLSTEWSKKLKEVEDASAVAADEARRALETMRSKLIAERVEQVNKLKDKHRQEMEDQWEQFMFDKESCLSRMKMECRQEGEEDRIKREKELLEEITDLKAQIHSKSSDYESLAAKAESCGRSLAVTEQELREALTREKDLREKRSEDGTRIKQLENNSKDQIDHLTRKCACLRKLFDDIRNRLAARERTAEQDSRAKDKELHHLRGEVARLTKILVEQSSPKLGARTRADGCEMLQADETKERRKGTKQPEVVRKRTCPLPDLREVIKDGRPRAKSVDLPAVQVPVRIKQLEEKNRE